MPKLPLLQLLHCDDLLLFCLICGKNYIFLWFRVLLEENKQFDEILLGFVCFVHIFPPTLNS